MNENGMSPADVYAVTRQNYGYGDGFGMGGSWIWIIALLAMFGGFGGGFGWGGNGFGNFTTDSGLLGYALGNNATKSDLSDGLNSVQTMNKLDNLTSQIGQSFADTRMQVCDGFNSSNITNLQGFNATQREMLQGFNAQNILALQNTASLSQAIDNNRFANQKCCCEVKTAIANSDALNFRNTCDIEKAIHEDGEKTRAVLIADKIASLEEKLAERARELQTAQIEASQQAQTNALISALRPTPIPAYASCSPYMSNLYASGFGGCGCNNFMS